MTNLGLIFIIAAWILQFTSMSKKNHKIERNFVAVYSVGVLLLVVDGYLSGLYTMAALNFVSSAAAAAVYLKINNKKGDGK